VRERVLVELFPTVVLVRGAVVTVAEDAAVCAETWMAERSVIARSAKRRIMKLKAILAWWTRRDRVLTASDREKEYSPTQGREVEDTHSLTPELMLEVGVVALYVWPWLFHVNSTKQDSAGIIKKRSQMLAWLAWSRTRDTG
jgi:hypothetical protein